MRTGRHPRFMRVVRAYLHEVKARLCIAAGCMLGVTLAQLLAPWPLKFIFDQILLDRPLPASLSFLSGLQHGGKVVPLVVMAVAILLLALLRGVFSYSQLYITSRIAVELAYALRRKLFVHLQRLSLSFHKQARSGELLTKLTSDTDAVKEVFAVSPLTVGADLLMLLGMFVIMLLMNWQLSVVVLATFPILFWAGFRLYRDIKASAKRQRRHEGRIVSRLSEILTSVALVQAFGRERYEEERFEADSAETRTEGIRAARLEAAATRTVEILGAAATGVAVFFGALQVLKGGLTPGELLIFTSYVTHMYKPIRSVTKLLAKLPKTVVSMDRIEEILAVEPDIQDAPDAIDPTGLKGEIAFDEVSFDYGDGKAVLKGLSFTVSPGQHVVLVGTSGAGKSTLVNLILRFYDPVEGAILIDGVNITRYRCDALRRQIGIAPQDPMLLGASIDENIAYGKPEAVMEEIVAAARAANAHDFIAGLEQGYETVVAERGGSLSAGQRQRISIARAMIRNAPILILDEPMTNLDIESETQVRDALKRLMAGRTCLLITHDLQAAAEADLILVLEEGRIVESGTHEELTTRGGRYRRLCELQFNPIGASPGLDDDSRRRGAGVEVDG